MELVPPAAQESAEVRELNPDVEGKQLVLLQRFRAVIDEVRGPLELTQIDIVGALEIVKMEAVAKGIVATGLEELALEDDD